MKKTFFEIIIHSLKSFLWSQEDGFSFSLENLEKNFSKNDWIFYLYSYRQKEIKAMIWQMKYRANRKIANFLGEKMAQIIIEKKLTDYILVPIPIHWRRKMERGFNQTEWLSLAIIKTLKKNNIKMEMWKILKRKIYTPKQSWQNKTERIKNIKSVFSFRENFSKKIKNKKLLLIDDVVTTGATLSEARETIPVGLAEIKGLVTAG